MDDGNGKLAKMLRGDEKKKKQILIMKKTKRKMLRDHG